MYNTLKDSGLAEVCESISHICSNYTWSSEKLRKKVLGEFNSRLSRITDTKSIVVSSAILRSIRCALRDNKSHSKRMKSAKNQYAFNIILKAASYKSGLSRRDISRSLGISRKSSVFKTFKIVDPLCQSDEELSPSKKAKKGCEKTAEKSLCIVQVFLLLSSHL